MPGGGFFLGILGIFLECGDYARGDDAFYA